MKLSDSEWNALRLTMGEMVKGEPVSPRDLAARLRKGFTLMGHEGITAMAAAGLDMAAWDALALAKGVPLVELLGGVDGFHQHLEEVLSEVGFLKIDHPKQLKLRLRRIFHRSNPDQTEINILRGMLAALDPRAQRRQRKHK